MDDAALLPATALAVVPGFNVPELRGLTLVLDFETMAAIYLGQITMWNDDRIKALNSIEVVAGLPVQPIIVITQSISSSVTQAFTTALNLTVPEFSAQVGAGTLVSYPVQADVNRSIVTGAVDGIMSNLRDVRYSFTTWLAYEILLSRTLGVVSLKKSDGTVVHPTVDSVKVALNDYLSSGSGLAYDLMLLGTTKHELSFARLAAAHTHRHHRHQVKAQMPGRSPRLRRSSTGSAR
ncbi:phosphate ABC transporter, periplasmic phosphatebinding protein [Acanthamoeba castellanii str. Neff]|uniref:Phosphate ABC transporter, periplasmic phosphatebinding protein n=1 Tax=Acanthamoeba castellanii (strain ATCC 30010 / Neff) TaxID=1257118 RepID=L8H5Q0_ACACF|nr:phosphate ABC transporter, periplasmic phosphatebinding protein [Acanthamoeba castellanii str. Neff]ELR20490.1 phosphate ABC transporter, periplasmic phosphatebinding protein [Acanthamoeba castellanii str. Neff]